MRMMNFIIPLSANWNNHQKLIQESDIISFLKSFDSLLNQHMLKNKDKEELLSISDEQRDEMKLNILWRVVK